MSGATAATDAARKVSPFAVPFLGLLGGVQGSAPNISNTALVGASRGLDMGSTMALAGSIQTLAVAASVISTGLLADRLGRRKVLMAALVLGAIGQLVVAAAPTTIIYLLGQALTGVGLGAVYGAAFGFIRAVTPPGKLPGAMGVFTAGVMVSTLVMTFAGGALSSLNWRAAFLLMPVVCAICFFLTPVLLPNEPPLPNVSKDYVGQLLLALGLIAFLYGVSLSSRSLTAPKTLIAIVLGIALIAGFFIFESKHKDAFFPVSLFRSPVFLAAIMAGFIYNFGTAVSFLQLTNLWQYVGNLKTLEVAVWQMPLILSGIVGGLLFGRLMTRGMTNRVALLSGAVITAVGFVSLSFVSNSKSLLVFSLPMLLVGAGVVIASIPYGNLFIKEAPPDRFGPVTSARTTVGQFFYSIGIAVSTIVIDKLTRGGVVAKLEAAGVPPSQTGQGIDAVTAYAAQSTAPTTSLGKAALADATSAYASAFGTMMIITGALCLVAGLIAFVLLKRAILHDEHSATSQHAPATAS